MSNFFDFRNFGKIPLKIWEISKFPYSRKNFTGTPKNFRYTRGNFHVTDIENQTTN